MSRWKCNLELLFCALIWGCAFVAQSSGMDYVGPWTFNCVRNIVGSLTLIILMPLIQRVRGVKDVKDDPKTMLKAGLICGTCLGVGSMFQQIGLQFMTTGKAGFISSLYIVLVPLFAIFLGKKIRKIIWIGVGIAVAGFYFLCFKGDLSVAFGDILLLCCAIVYSWQILAVDHYSPIVDGVRLSLAQLVVSGIISAFGMLLFETPTMEGIVAAAVPILYAGCVSSGLAYTLQILGQKDADPAVASMIMSLESVFSALAGFVLLHQVLSFRELFGCALIFLAVILTQLPEKRN